MPTFDTAPAADWPLPSVDWPVTASLGVAPGPELTPGAGQGLSPTRPPWRRAARGARVLRRAVDLLVAGAWLLAAAPCWILAAGCHLRGLPLLERQPSWGHRRRVFDALVVRRNHLWGARLQAWHLAGFPAAWQLLLGRLSLVGPRLATIDDPALGTPAARPRYRVRPGLVGLAALRRRTNIDYAAEWEIDLEYLTRRSVRSDAGLVLRMALVGWYGQRGVEFAARPVIAGVTIDNLTMSQAVARIIGWARGDRPVQVAFVNADCALLAADQPDYAQVLARTQCNLADGIGLKLAGRLLGSELRQNLCGTDLVPGLCAALEGTEIALYLLGGRPGVAEGMARWIAKRYPGCRVAGQRDGYFSSAEEPAVLSEIAASGARVLLVALGAPRQELWIDRCLAASGARVGLGVGGLFDFYSGRVPRAPLWLRELGLEWAYRLWQEPARMWRRYVLGNPRFVWRVLRERRARRRGASASQARTTNS